MSDFTVVGDTSLDTSGASSGFSKMGTVAKVGMAAMAVGTAALVTSAVNAYADYEQLTGGIDKLFGDSSQTVQTYAENAYKTAGISANDYMELTTTFSAALIGSLGGDTEAAAKVANTAITDMSDNANTFGTSTEAIQNAYTGFAKGNFTIKSIVCYMREYIASVCEPYQGCEA